MYLRLSSIVNLISCFCAFGLNAFATSDIAEPVLAVPPGVAVSSVIWVYGVLILLAGLTAYALWRKGSFRLSGTCESYLKIRENRIIGPKQCLLVVEYEGEKMLLGVSPGILRHLCFLDTGGLNASGVKHTTSPTPDFESLLQVDGVKESLVRSGKTRKQKARS